MWVRGRLGPVHKIDAPHRSNGRRKRHLYDVTIRAQYMIGQQQLSQTKGCAVLPRNAILVVAKTAATRQRQVRHMMQLVDDLLDISRVTRGSLTLRRQRVDLLDALARAIEIASPLLEQRRHHFEIDAPEHPVSVDGDDARLTQVFTNLLVNSLLNR